MPSKFGDWSLSTGLKKEFFSRLQNIEPALVPYKPSSLVRIQESNILGWRRRIVGESSDCRMNLSPWPWTWRVTGSPFPVLGNPSTVEKTLPRAPKRERCLNFIKAVSRVMKPRENHIGFPCVGESFLLVDRILPRAMFSCQCPQLEDPKGRSTEALPRTA